MKKVAILGAAGFIGLALTRRLKAEGYHVTGVDRYWRQKEAGVNCIVGDVFDSALLQEVLAEQDTVIHLVSTTVPASSNKSPVFDCETNIIGTLRILDAMVKYHVPRIVFASSGGTVYGIPESLPIAENAPNFPISAYGIGKLAIEKYLYLYASLHGLRACALRLSNPYGPGQDAEKGQGVCAAFLHRILHGEPIDIWGDGSVVRDFIYIDDAVDAFIAAMSHDAPFDVFNIGAGTGKSLRDILQEIEKQLALHAQVQYHPNRDCDVPAIILDIEKAQQHLHWQPKHPFEAGIRKTIEQLQLQAAQ